MSTLCIHVLCVRELSRLETATAAESSLKNGDLTVRQFNFSDLGGIPTTQGAADAMMDFLRKM